MTLSGWNLRDALAFARRLGCEIHCPRRTGELRVSHPSQRRSVRVNARRKDAPRELTTFLRRVYDYLHSNKQAS